MAKVAHIGSGTPSDPWTCQRPWCARQWTGKSDAKGKPIKPRYCASCRSAAWDKTLTAAQLERFKHLLQ